MIFNLEYKTEVFISDDGLVLIEQEDEFQEKSSVMFSKDRLIQVADAALRLHKEWEIGSDKGGD